MSTTGNLDMRIVHGNMTILVLGDAPDTEHVVEALNHRLDQGALVITNATDATVVLPIVRIPDVSTELFRSRPHSDPWYAALYDRRGRRRRAK